MNESLKQTMQKKANEYATAAVPQFETAESKILTKAYRIGFEAGFEACYAEVIEVCKRELFHYLVSENFNKYIKELI